MAVARIWPFYSPAAKPPAPKVFALTNAEWLALRATDGMDAKGAQQSQSTQGKKTAPDANSTNADQKKSQSADEKKAKTDGKKLPPCPPNTKKGAGDKKKSATKPCVRGPGGGDGDMDGGGG